MAETLTISVWIPGSLRAYANGRSSIPLSATTVGHALDRLAADHPSLHRNLCDETGAVRRHINLFVNSTHIRDRDGLDTPLSPGDVIVVVPAVSGG